MALENTRYKSIGNTFDRVYGNFAAQDRARFGWLHRKQPHLGIDRTKRLAHADQGTAGADTQYQRVRQLAHRQLGEDFRSQHLTVFVHIPF